MTTLHVYFSLRNQKAFQRVLDASRPQPSSKPGTSTSGGKSWNRPSPLSSGKLFSTVDVNARDSSGRTALHLAASATDASAPEYVRMLLAHPSINVNLADTENHWTALHRALYNGNITIAVQLVQRSDIDISLKDFEGYTAFDLYNSTVEGTRPALDEGKETGKRRVVGDLLTWGANRNATLGVGDGDDRAFPEQIVVESAQAASRGESSPIKDRFAPTRVQDVAMSRLHTGVVTDESRANLYVCGFGSGGRLGPGQHTQYSLVPVPQLSQAIVSVALGQDHTLALTNAGEVLSWGLNRFAQLGYVVEAPSGALSRIEEPIQATPRKVSAPGLKGKIVRGVAACKTASACWTATEVFSWGTNSGQLGYDKTAHPVQILPRVVTKISQPVISVTITDTAMACLLETNDVVCIYNDNHFRVNFPAHTFPSEMKTYRPPQAIRNASIDKITSCDTLIAALSTNGELFTFNLPAVSDSGSSTPSSGKIREMVKPQRVWALRKKFSSVKDVALGADGSIIICTESGHVFVRSRTSGKAFKFQRMPYLQRVVKVAANSTGAYAALRVDAVPTPIPVRGNLFPEDMASILPYGSKPQQLPVPFPAKELPEFLVTSDAAHPGGKKSSIPIVETTNGDYCPDPPLVTTKADVITALAAPGPTADEEPEMEEEREDKAIAEDHQELVRICTLLEKHKHSQQDATADDRGDILDDRGDILGDRGEAPHGADLIIHVQNGSQPKIPAHRVVLAARSAILADVLAGRQAIEHGGLKIALSRPSRPPGRHISPQAPWKDPMRLSVTGCHPLTVFILLEYLYSDRLLALWDWRVAEGLEEFFASLKIKPPRIKEELQGFAKALEIPALVDALLGTFKRDVRKTMSEHFLRLHDFCTTVTAFVHKDGLTPDVVLCLEDKNVSCHSAVLRARSPLFRAFFDDDDWTRTRWANDGTTQVQLKHLKWRSMQYVMKFIYGGDMEIFDVLEFISSVDELIDFMFDVMSAANELLLDRLVLICSSIILSRVSISNVCAVLSEATFYHAAPLVKSLQGYMAQNLETLSESKMLDDHEPGLVKALSASVREAQAKKSHITRSNALVDTAMAKNADWLALQDIPQPIIPSMRTPAPRDGPKLSPPMHARPSKSPEVSPIIRPQLPDRPNRSDKYVVVEDEVFMMDGLEAVPPLSLGQEQPGQSKSDVADFTPRSSVGWKVPSVSAPRMDMKAIMAEAETKKAVPIRTVVATATPVSGSPSDTANWRAPPRQTKPSVSDSPRTPGSSPWKTLPSTTTPLLSNTPTQTPPMTPLLKPTRANEEARAQGSPSAMRSQPPTPQRPGMGPVFTPSRQPVVKSASLSPSIRRTSSSTWTNSAWVMPPVQPVVQPSPSTSMVSFADIQRAQQEQVPPKQDKRSLKDIQEEERARQVEDDFLTWWAAEEQRLKLEQETAPPPKKQPKPKNKGKKPSAAKGTSQPIPKEGPAAASAPPPAEQSTNKNSGATQRKQPGKSKGKQARQDPKLNPNPTRNSP